MSIDTLRQHPLLSKTSLALICVLGMFAGFLLSRAVLSFFTFSFGVISLYDVHPKRWFKDKWWLLGVGWIVCYALSYFWTDDTANWHYRFDVKLPILLLPLAFTFLPRFSARQLQVFTIGTGFILSASVVYSLSFFIANTAYYAEQYVYSQVLPTLADSDHIRYSLTLSLFVIWCIYYWPRLQGNWAKGIIAAIVLLLSVYLHILAASTGLLIWYLFILLSCIRLLFSKKACKGILVIIGLAIGATLAVKYIPTLEKRIWYLKYTLELYQKGEMTSSFSDMGRFISYRIATHRIALHPFTGTGAGDMQAEMNKGYDEMYPNVPAEFRLLPHNQFLIVSLGCGVVALILFTAWIFYPLIWVKRNRDGFFFFTVWLSLLLALLVEPMLEVQLGVFVYLFFLLWHRHNMPLLKSN